MHVPGFCLCIYMYFVQVLSKEHATWRTVVFQREANNEYVPKPTHRRAE